MEHSPPEEPHETKHGGDPITPRRILDPLWRVSGSRVLFWYIQRRRKSEKDLGGADAPFLNEGSRPLDGFGEEDSPSPNQMNKEQD